MKQIAGHGGVFIVDIVVIDVAIGNVRDERVIVVIGIRGTEPRGANNKEEKRNTRMLWFYPYELSIKRIEIKGNRQNCKNSYK